MLAASSPVSTGAAVLMSCLSWSALCRTTLRADFSTFGPSRRMSPIAAAKPSNLNVTTFYSRQSPARNARALPAVSRLECGVYRYSVADCLTFSEHSPPSIIRCYERHETKSLGDLPRRELPLVTVPESAAAHLRAIRAMVACAMTLKESNQVRVGDLRF